jgi:hypothetical protein
MTSLRQLTQHSESDKQSGCVHDRQAGDEAKQRDEGQPRVARPLRRAMQVSRELNHHLENGAGADPKAQRSPMWREGEGAAPGAKHRR